MNKQFIVTILVLLFCISPAFAGKILYAAKDDWGQKYTVQYVSQGRYLLSMPSGVTRLEFNSKDSAIGVNEDGEGVYIVYSKLGTTATVGRLGSQTLIPLSENSALYIMFMAARKHYLSQTKKNKG